MKTKLEELENNISLLKVEQVASTVLDHYLDNELTNKQTLLPVEKAFVSYLKRISDESIEMVKFNERHSYLKDEEELMSTLFISADTLLDLVTNLDKKHISTEYARLILIEYYNRLCVIENTKGNAK